MLPRLQERCTHQYGVEDRISQRVDVDRQAGDMFLRLVKEYADRQGVTEQLKAENPHEWIRRMNNIQACVREVVGKELIYI